MDILLNSLYLLAGIGLLWKGADLLVDGSKGLALKFGIRPLIVGLTVVAFGTSAPELFVSLVATFKDAEGMAVGNIIGSNMANIALVLSVAALIKPINCRRSTLKIHLPFMLLTSVMFYIFSLNEYFSRIEGFILLLLLTCYIIYCAKTSKDADTVRNNQPSKSKLHYIGKTVAGCAGVVLGADLLVMGGIFWARHYGIDEIVIGLTVFAVGTSLPELATSVSAMLKGDDDISLGNIVGSNIQNVALVIAIIGCISTLKIPAIALKIDFPVMIGLSCLLYGILYFSKKLNRNKNVRFLENQIPRLLFN